MYELKIKDILRHTAIVSFSMAIGSLISGCDKELFENHFSGRSDTEVGDSAATIKSNDELVVEPINISGTYLTCQITQEPAPDQANGIVSCGIKNKEDDTKAALADLVDVTLWSHQGSEDTNIEIVSEDTPEASPWHQIYRFSGIDFTDLLAAIRDTQIRFQGGVKGTANTASYSAAKVVSSSVIAELPEKFAVYYNGNLVINQPSAGFEKRILPTVNYTYNDIDGCYVACYSTNETNAVYETSAGIYVHGMMRLQGYYEGTTCRLTMELADRLDRDPAIKALCVNNIDSCQDGCWGGGNTGGFIGIQSLSGGG